jgi:hypothetical protein
MFIKLGKLFFFFFSHSPIFLKLPLDLWSHIDLTNPMVILKSIKAREK